MLDEYEYKKIPISVISSNNCSIVTSQGRSIPQGLELGQTKWLVALQQEFSAIGCDRLRNS